MAEPAFNSATVVLGMHRSGTSALAGVLRLCGLAVPRTLIAADESNERGLWESEPIKCLNDELLAKLGLTWHSIARIDSAGLAGRKFREGRKLASSLLTTEYDPQTDIMLKEPRICRLLPFWMPVLQRLTKRLGYAFIVRHPLEVARSLSRRNDFDLHHALLLWARYWLDSEFHTRGKSRAFAAYPHLLQNWRATIGDLCQRLELPIDLKAINASEIEEYLAPDLRHEVVSGEEALGSSARIVTDTYRVLCAWCESGGESSSDYEALDAAREQLDRMSGLVAEIFENSRRDRKRLMSARRDVERSGQDLSLALRSLDQQSHEVESLRLEATRIEEIRRDLDGGLAALEERMQPILRGISEGLTDSQARDRAMAAAVMAMAKDQENTLRAVESDIESAFSEIKRVADTSTRLERALATAAEFERATQVAHAEEFSVVRSSIEDRRLVEQALADATRIAAEELPEVKSSIEDRRLVEQALADATRVAAEELPQVKSSIEDRRLVEQALVDATRVAAEELPQVKSSIEDRRLVEQALVDATRVAKDATGKIETALGAVTQLERDIQATCETEFLELRTSLADRIFVEQALADATRVAADANERLEGAVGKLAETEGELRLVREREEALAAELHSVKRKYRAAQSDVERERRQHDETNGRLAVAEATIARYKASLLWSTYMAAAGWASQVREAIKRVSSGSRRRRKTQLRTIKESGLFDPNWYLTAYPDVAAAQVDPLIHFFEKGWLEGRDPGPDFASSAYLKANSDVARMGVNPLIHYVEFGRFEGRELRVGRASNEPVAAAGRDVGAAISHDFPDPAPVFRGEAKEPTPIRWLRSYRLQRDDPRLLTISELHIGYSDGESLRAQIESEFGRLARLSGIQIGDRPKGIAEPSYPSAELVDAWYVNEAQLRVRWRDEGLPFVLRAFQHDTLNDGRLSLIGEGIVRSELDFVDLSLRNPYFPLSLVFASPDGVIRGARLLAFPSLCRGGVHYSELICASAQSPDPLAVGLAEARRLEMLKNGTGRLVHSITVDMSGADGTGALFQPGFRKWLRQVMGVTLRPAGSGNELLNELLRPDGDDASESGGSLVLAADMMPAIHALTEAQDKRKGSSGPIFVPLLIADQDPSQPATFVELPRKTPANLQINVTQYPAAWPQLDGACLPQRIGPAAIRVRSAAELSDSELVLPVSGPLPFAEMEPADITWLIRPENWQTSELLQSVRALSLQHYAGSQAIGFIGEADPESLGLAETLFRQQVRVFENQSDAALKIATPLVGYMGPGVILHNLRSVALLSQLAGDRAVASASCVLVRAEKRGRGWHFSIVDDDSFSTALSTQGSPRYQQRDLRLWWRSSFPVLRPPHDLWIARADCAKKWLENSSAAPSPTGMHVCTSLVTASYLSSPSEITRGDPVPSAKEDQTTEVRVLFG